MDKADYIFTRAIRDDEDFLQKAIGLSEEAKESIFRSVGYRKGVELIGWLRDNYTKEEILEIFYSINTNMVESNLVQNTIKIFKSLSSRMLYHNFKKVNNSFIELHNEFTRLKVIENDWLVANPKPKSKSGLGYPPLPINNSDYYPYGFF